MLKNYAIILAAGSGSRLKVNTPKAFLKLNDLYLLEYSMLTLLSIEEICGIILVIPEAFVGMTKQIIEDKNYPENIKVIKGGNNRFESSKIGISLIDDPKAKVLIHDAARPFVSKRIIQDCLLKLQLNDAVNTLAPITDTVVRIQNNEIIETVDRELYRQTQTPQGFDLNCLKKAHKYAKDHNIKDITDDFGLVLKLKTARCAWVNGESMNFKITHKDDLALAKYYLSLKE